MSANLHNTVGRADTGGSGGSPPENVFSFAAVNPIFNQKTYSSVVATVFLRIVQFGKVTRNHQSFIMLNKFIHLMTLFYILKRVGEVLQNY